MVDGAAVGATIGIKAPPRVYVLGVVAQKTPNAPVNQVYDPRTDTWTTVAAMPTIRIDFGVAVVNDTLYVIGGLLVSYTYDSTGKYIQSSQATPTNINEQYIPLGYGTLHPTTSPTPAVPEFSWLAVLPLFAVMFFIAVKLKDC